MPVLTIWPSDIRKPIQGHHDLFDFQRPFDNQRAAAPKHNRSVARGLGKEKAGSVSSNTIASFLFSSKSRRI